MTEKLNEFRKQIEQMSEMERVKYLAEAWKGFYYARKAETGTSTVRKNMAEPYDPHFGSGYFWKVIIICHNVSGEYLWGNEKYLEWVKEKNKKIKEKEAEREKIFNENTK